MKTSLGTNASQKLLTASGEEAAQAELIFAALFGGVVASTELEETGDAIAADTSLAVAAHSQWLPGFNAKQDGQNKSTTQTLLEGEVALGLDGDKLLENGGLGEAEIIANPLLVGDVQQPKIVAPLNGPAVNGPAVNGSAVNSLAVNSEAGVGEAEIEGFQGGKSLAPMAFEDGQGNNDNKGQKHPVLTGMTSDTADADDFGEAHGRKGQLSANILQDAAFDKKPAARQAADAANATVTSEDSIETMETGQAKANSFSNNGRMFANDAEIAMLRQSGQMTVAGGGEAENLRTALAASLQGGGGFHQNNGQGNGQNGSQSNGQFTATAGSPLMNEAMMEMLDMAQDNWTEMLLQRVQKGLSGGKDALNFQLNPHNLGKMRISLLVQNDRASIQIQTESAAAASMLGEAEGRLAQMMEASGLKLGSLSSHHGQGAAGDMAGQQSRQEGDNSGERQRTAGVQSNGGEDVEIDALENASSDNIINIQA